jgi:acetyl esterase
LSLDPRLRALLWLGSKAPAVDYARMPPHRARRAFTNEVASVRPFFGRGPKMAEESIMMLGVSGIRAKVYRPRPADLAADREPYARPAESRLPVILFFHGGGWVVGSPETHDSLARQIARAARALVVSVDYRLAPEHPFPGAIDDAYASVLWARDHAHAIGGDGKRLAVCGDSAGGNLAAAVSLRAREDLGPQLRAQILIYPATKPDFETRSYLENATGYGLTRERMQWYWQQYLPEDKQRHPLAAPALAPSLKDLPPATVLTAEHDVLRDEGDMYAEALYRAGNDVAHRRVSGVIHGYIMMHRLLRSARESIDFIGHRLRAAWE